MPDLPQDSSFSEADSSRDESPSREFLLNEIIASYLEAVEQGEAVDARACIARHPDFAAELSQYFDDRARLLDDAGDMPIARDESSTSTSLLARVKARDADAWAKLSRLYGPMIYRWSRRMDLQASDATDMMPEVFRAVATHTSEFRRERPSDSFRGWLYSITRNKVRDHLRREGRQPSAEGGSEPLSRMLAVPDGASDDASITGASAHADLTHRIVEMVRAEFTPQSWQAFWRTAVDGLSAAEAAAELGVNVGVIYMAKSRVLARLRQELAGLGDG